LALRIVEVRRHRDHHAFDRSTERLLGARLELFQDLRGDLDRRELAVANSHADRAVVADQLVRQHALHTREVLHAAADQPLHRRQRALRLFERHRLRAATDEHTAARRVPHDRWHHRIGADHERPTILDVRDEAIRRAEVDPDNARLAGLLDRRLARLCDLHQHLVSPRRPARRRIPRGIDRGSAAGSVVP
jgi:hypothetical protein